MGNWSKYKNIWKNISYKFESSKITSIVGPSGSGKTLLFNIITNLVKDYDGSILINNKEYKYKLKDLINQYVGVDERFQYIMDKAPHIPEIQTHLAEHREKMRILLKQIEEIIGISIDDLFK